MTTETITNVERLFKNDKVASNMPFFDGKTLLFCQSGDPVQTNVRTTGTIFKAIRRNKVLAEKLKNLPREQSVTYRAWKLAYCNLPDTTIYPINIGLPGNVAERSPSFYRENGLIHLSFISGGPTSAGFHYRLYTCSGPDFEHLSPPQSVDKPPLYFGFVSPLHICWGAGNTVQLTDKSTGKNFSLTTSFYRVASVSFLAEDPSLFLITGILNRDFECQSVLYDLKTGETSDVSAGGSVYKSSLHGRKLFFAQRSDEVFENRHLIQAEATLSPSTIQISKGE